MNIIKEYCPQVGRCVVRTDAYDHTLRFFLHLFKEAKKDFPILSTEDVEITRFGGQHYKGSFGIEFSAKAVPESYRKINNLEIL